MTDHTKHNNPCLLNAKDDEPIFVLRAQDALAPLVVEYWASKAEQLDCNGAKTSDAMDTAQAMRDWAKKNGRKLPD